MGIDFVFLSRLKCNDNDKQNRMPLGLIRVILLISMDHC